MDNVVVGSGVCGQLEFFDVKYVDWLGGGKQFLLEMFVDAFLRRRETKDATHEELCSEILELLGDEVAASFAQNKGLTAQQFCWGLALHRFIVTAAYRYQQMVCTIPILSPKLRKYLNEAFTFWREYTRRIRAYEAARVVVTTHAVKAAKDALEKLRADGAPQPDVGEAR